MLNALWQDINRYRDHPEQSVLIVFVKALYTHPSFLGVVWYRLSRGLWLKRDNGLCMLLFVVARLFYPLVRLYSGVELAPSAELGPGLWIGHFGPTIIHPKTRAGRNLTILHGTTIGAGKSGVPLLGDDVRIGAGAIIIGGVNIGSHAIVGAGAVVTKDVPEHTLSVGVAARQIP